MSKENPLRLVVSSLSNEKGVPEVVIFQAIEAALVSASRKKHGMDWNIRVDLDPKTGLYETYRLWTVVSDELPLECPESQIHQSEAAEKAATEGLAPPAVGDTIQQALESVEFGRIAAQAARQVMTHKVREAERTVLADQFKQQVGQLVTGTVKKVMREAIIVDLGHNAEGLLKKDQVLPREMFRPGDRVRSYLKMVDLEARGPQIILSRTANEALVELFKIEVPEVGEGIIEIKAVARDPGFRAKIAVKTNDGRIDPVGACVGMRGARVQAVSNELGGERVDVVLWDDHPAQFVMNAMSPAEIVSIVVDEDTRVMDIAVSDATLSQAIGRNGQNVRLASELTGWTLNVMADSDAKERASEEQNRLRSLFMEALQIDEGVADVLIEEGFTNLEEVAYVPFQEMLAIEAFDEETIKELKQRAKDTLSEQVKVLEAELAALSVENALLELKGVDLHLALKLAHAGIKTREDLADQSVDELVAMTGLKDAVAADLILQARAHWFA